MAEGQGERRGDTVASTARVCTKESLLGNVKVNQFRAGFLGLVASLGDGDTTSVSTIALKSSPTTSGIARPHLSSRATTSLSTPGTGDFLHPPSSAVLARRTSACFPEDARAAQAIRASVAIASSSATSMISSRSECYGGDHGFCSGSCQPSR